MLIFIDFDTKCSDISTISLILSCTNSKMCVVIYGIMPITMKFGMEEYTTGPLLLAQIGDGWVQEPPELKNLVKIMVFSSFSGFPPLPHPFSFPSSLPFPFLPFPHPSLSRPLFPFLALFLPFHFPYLPFPTPFLIISFPFPSFRWTVQRYRHAAGGAATRVTA